jgi:ABC-type Fe3+-hydroxamate transport system substrate-binding protein
LNSFIDQLNRKIELPFLPKRIISLVPSQTELLHDLGLNNEVVGITNYCIHPNKWLTTKTRVGGTKNVQFEKIKNLRPDLIIGNKEENDQKQIEELMKLYPVWMSDINTLKDALDMITKIGALIGKQTEAALLNLKIESGFGRLSKGFVENNSFTETLSIKIAYFIWRKPFMVVGNNTFINDMLIRCGFNNIFGTSDLMRYPEINLAQLVEANPEIIFLSSEPYPFKEKHIKEFQLICPNSKIIIVDGEMFSWYGSHLIKAPIYFEKVKTQLNTITNN